MQISKKIIIGVLALFLLSFVAGCGLVTTEHEYRIEVTGEEGVEFEGFYFRAEGTDTHAERIPSEEEQEEGVEVYEVPSTFEFISFGDTFAAGFTNISGGEMVVEFYKDGELIDSRETSEAGDEVDFSERRFLREQ